MGLILCSEQDDPVAHYALEGLKNTLLAREYQLEPPDEGRLAKQIEETRRSVTGGVKLDYRGGGKVDHIERAGVPVFRHCAIGSVNRFIMRRVSPPEGAIDFAILGESGAPAILSLIASDPDRYANHTYNGFDADMDVSHGGKSGPLDGTGSANVWLG